MFVYNLRKILKKTLVLHTCNLIHVTFFKEKYAEFETFPNNDFN